MAVTPRRSALEAHLFVTFRTIAGLSLIALALLANPWFLERFVVLDGSISGKSRIVAVEGVLALVGLLLAWSGLRSSRGAGLSGRDRLFAMIAIGIAALASIGFAEVVLRLFVDPGIVLEGERWSEYRWRARHAAPETEIIEGQYDYDRFHPTVGWVPAPSYSGEGIETNAMGIRATREYAFERTPGVRRIVLIGDSYTWGEKTWKGPISNAQTFSALLEERLPRLEAINLGVHGWGTDQQLLYLRELGLRFQPDLVILGFFEADISRNVVDFFGYSKPRFVLEDGELVLTNTPILEGGALLETPFEMPSFYLGSLVRKGVNTALDRTKLRPIEGREEWHVTRAIFEAARRESEAAGAELVIVDIPFHVRTEPTPVERAVASWAAETGTRFVSLREHFLSMPPEDWESVHDGHFTARGHDETARALQAYIEREGLLPAPAER